MSADSAAFRCEATLRVKSQQGAMFSSSLMRERTVRGLIW